MGHYVIFDRIIDLISQKSDITFVVSHNFARIKIDSYDSLSLSKNIYFHNVLILIKSESNKDQSDYYYNTFL